MRVSGHQARVVVDGQSVVLADLQSTKGTFVNERRVELVEFRPNDWITDREAHSDPEGRLALRWPHLAAGQGSKVEGRQAARSVVVHDSAYRCRCPLGRKEA
jgi:pSer/pThr/pTyr-binding forkhead associated (FHA) protein